MRPGRRSDAESGRSAPVWNLKSPLRTAQLLRCYGVLPTEGHCRWSVERALRAPRVEVSTLRCSPGSLGLHGKTPLLRLQSDERLIAFIRRGNHSAFDVLFSRYQTSLLAFC